MRILSPIFSFVVWVFSFVVGVALLVAGFYPRLLFEDVPNFLYKQGAERTLQSVVGLVGAVLVLMVVLRLAFLVSRGERRERIISFPSSAGNVNVSLDTIETFLARGGSSLPEVDRLTVRLTPVDNGTTVKADVMAWVYLGGRNARELGERLRGYFVDATKDVLGLQEIGDVTITVREVIESEARGGTQAR
jgi:hypothetical protein